MAHKYYQPTDYEEMMLAAGWVTMADLDDDYRRFVKTTPIDAEYVPDYDGWIAMRREWDALNAEYEVKYDRYWERGELSYDEKQEEKQLLNQMTRIEYALGY